MSSFPPWLDPRTLQWAADYCHAMAIQLGDVRDVPFGYHRAVGADVCARGLRDICAEVQAGQRSALSGMEANVAAAIKANRHD